MGVKKIVKVSSQFKAVSTLAAGLTPVWAPAAGNYVRILRYRLLISGDAYAAANALTLQLADAATLLAFTAFRLAVPIAAPAAVTRGALWDSGTIDLDRGYRTTAIGDAVNVNLSQVLTAGAVTCLLWGLEGPWV